MTINGNAAPQSPSTANGFGRAVLGFVVGIIAFVFVWLASVIGCLVGLDVACTNGLNAAIVVALVVFVGMVIVALAPTITAASIEEKTAIVQYDHYAAQHQHENDMLEIERDRIKGMNDAAIERERAKTELVLSLGKAAAAGTFDPTTFIAIVNAANNDTAQFKLAPGVGFNVTALPQAEAFNPQEYRIIVSGGLDSPVETRQMPGGYLTCTLKSLHVAASIALAGEQPVRSAFEARGITAAEISSACQHFLNARGLLADSSHSRWVDGFKPGKFAKWVGVLTDNVNMRGGEASFLRAAAIQTQTVSLVVPNSNS